MGDAVIVAAARTPFGTARKGTLLDVSAYDLAKWAVGEAFKRSGVPAGDIDDVLVGEVMQGGGNIARHAAVELGLTDAPGAATQRQCASGMTAVQHAAASIRAGMDKVVIAGGAESLSTSPAFGTTRRKLFSDEMEPWMPPSHPTTEDAPAWDMSITVAWNTARRAGITREEMDEWALRSHERAVAAIDEHRFDEEVFSVEVPMRDGSTRVFQVDEHPRRGSTLEKLAGLMPLHPEIEGFSITAGNSSGINDGAAALVLVDADYAAAHGLRPFARVLSWASAGVPPRDTGYGPVYAIPRALDRAGLTIDDIDLAEVNEAFASVPIAACRELGLDPEITNVNGSGCSLGHPVAATGARMIMTTMFELARRGGGLGLASMCAGGGMGSATVFEVFPA